MQLLIYIHEEGKFPTTIYLSGSYTNYLEEGQVFNQMDAEVLRNLLLDHFKTAHNTTFTKRPATMGQLLKQLEKEREHLVIFRKENEDSSRLNQIPIEELETPSLPDEKVLEEFDNWAKAMRSTIEGLLNTGRIKIGQTIGFSDELEFYTSFLMEPSDEVLKKHYMGTIQSPNGLEYRGLICNNY